MERLRVCAYCRVSTNKNDQKNSLENQQSFFEREIKTNKELILTKIYVDKGISGTKLSRPSFDELLFDAGLDIVKVTNEDNDERKDRIKYVTIPSTTRKPKFDKILVSNTSRFGRNILIESILRDLRQNKVYVQFLDIGKSTENENDITYIQMFLSFDEQESRSRSKKVLFGHAEGTKQGKIHSTDRLFGYHYIKEENRLEIVPEEAEVILNIFEMYSQGFGIRRIINNLTENKCFTRQGRPFCKTAIRRILENEKYIGLNNRGKYFTGIVFEKFSYPKKKEVYELTETEKIPAIIQDRALFYKCEKMLMSKVNHSTQKGIYKGTSEYSNMIICGQCGAVYYSNIDRGRQYYLCKTKKQAGIAACNNPNISKKAIDKLIEQFRYNDLMENERNFAIMKNEAIAYNLMEMLDVDNSQQLKKIKKEIDKLNNKYTNLIELYDSKKIARKEKVISKISEVEKNIEQYEKEIEILNYSNSELVKKIQKLLANIEELKDMKIQNSMNKKEIIAFIDHITIKEHGEIQLTLKGDFFKEISNRLSMEGYEPLKMKYNYKKEEKELLLNKYKKVLQTI